MAEPKKSDAILNAGPMGGGGDFASPVGVPVGYVAPTGFQPLPPGVAGPPTPTVNQAPRYFDGDEFKPAGLPPERIAEMQRQMEAAGVIPKGAKYRVGIWDEVSRAAYRDLMGLANAMGNTLEAALNRYSTTKQLSIEDRKKNLPIKLTNDDDLRGVFDATWRARLGRKPTEDELARLLASFHTAETQEQQAFVADEFGGTFTAAPNAQTFAAQQAEAMNPGEAGAHDFAEQANVFFDLLDEVN